MSLYRVVRYQDKVPLNLDIKFYEDRSIIFHPLFGGMLVGQGGDTPSGINFSNKRRLFISAFLLGISATFCNFFNT